MERAISVELQDTGTYIPKTGVFDSVDKKYGTTNPLPNAVPGTPAGGAPTEPGEGANTGNPAPEAGATNAPQSINQLPEPQGAGGNAAPQTESISKKKSLNEDSFNDKLQMLIGIKSAQQIENESNDTLSKRAEELNKNAKQMITEIDNLIQKDISSTKK